MNFRILYFFSGRTTAVISHGIVKERVVPPRDINLAVRRCSAFAANPARHTVGA